MCAGFPRLGVLRRLRPVPGRSVVGAPSPAPPAGYGQQGKTRDSSRVHCGSLARVGARLYPCGLAASTPQSFLAASLAACAYRLGSSPPTYSAGARRSRPRSTRFEPVPHQGAITRRFLAYSSPSRSPDPDHLAVLARPGFVRAAPTLPGTTRIRLPSAPPSLDTLRRDQRRRPLTSTRTSAPHGARTCSGTPSSPPVRRWRRPARRADRRPPRRSSYHDPLRPGSQESRPPPQLHPRRLHGIRHLTHRASHRSSMHRETPGLAEMSAFRSCILMSWPECRQPSWQRSVRPRRCRRGNT